MKNVHQDVFDPDNLHIDVRDVRFFNLFGSSMSLTSQPLALRINSAVIHNPHLNHRRMRIRNDAGRITIQGSVQSFFEKQMAQETLRKIDGVESIENRLEVTWS